MRPGRKTAEQALFDGVGAITRAEQQADQKKEHPRRDPRTSKNWRDEADEALEAQKTLRARGLLYGVALVAALLLAWAAIAPIDEVTRAQGQVIPSQRLQVVQSVDGGTVQAILTEPGAAVDKGDMLMRIDPTRFQAELGKNEEQLFALRAKIDRLTALLDGKTYDPPMPDPSETDRRLVIERERAYFDESRNALEQRVANARERLQQREDALDEARAARNAAASAVKLSRQELEMTRPLLESGAVSEVEILRLERDLEAERGQLQQSRAAEERAQSRVAEARGMIEEVAHETRNNWRAELAEATAELNTRLSGASALSDRVTQTELRAPVGGTIQRVLPTTTGAVVQPGDKLIEIVPRDDRLVVEARVAPRDIAHLRTGLPAAIKLDAWDYAIHGSLTARVTHVSADTVTDERDNTYYLVQAEVTEPPEKRGMSVIPGMTGQVDIITGERTILAYLLKPILRATSNAMGER
jgi:adhesin transport system membrane fusion protein